MQEIEYKHPGFKRPIKLENICYKVVDQQRNYLPCFQISALDCFKEGEVNVIGGANNTQYMDAYATRTSYKNATYNFSTDFTRAYMKASCRQWYNLGVPYRLLFGGSTFAGAKQTSTMSSTVAMRTVLATFDEDRLAKVGLRYTDWTEGSATDGLDLLSCPASGPSLDDCSCTKNFALVTALSYGCEPADKPQTARCCNDFMKPVSEHKCAPYLWANNADVATIGSIVGKRCNLPPVQPLQPRCLIQASGETGPTPYTFPQMNAAQCSAIINPASSSCVKAQTGKDYSSALTCCRELEKFTDGGCPCSHCDGACAAVLTSAERLCQGFRVKDQTSCPAPTFADDTEKCTWKWNRLLALYGRYSSEKDPTKKRAEGVAMCTQAGELDNLKCHCLSPAVLNVAQLTQIQGGCAQVAGTTFTGLSSCAAPAPAPAPAPNPSGSAATCGPLYQDYGIKCAAAKAAPGDIPKASACCDAAIPFGANNCTCSFGVMSDFNKVADDCKLLNKNISKPKCLTDQITTCGVNGADMTTKCTAAAADRSDTAKGLACCTAATPYGAANCSCMLPDDSSHTGKLTFGNIATSCGAVGLSVNIPPCVQAVMSTPPPAPAPPKKYEIPKDSTVPVTAEQAKAIIEGWEKAWLDAIPAKISNYTHIDVAYIAGRSVEDIIEEASGGVYGLVAVGYVLVIVYITLFFAFGSSGDGTCAVDGSAPGIISGIAAALTIIIATFSALGVSGMLVSAGVMFTAITMQVVPFLALGLGINDYFVMANYVSAALAAAAPAATPADVLAEALKHAGGSITLSSVTNLAAFLIGAMTPIPAVRYFAIQVAMTVICNYVAAICIYPSLLYFDIKRSQLKIKDCCVLAVKTRSENSTNAGDKKSSGGGIIGFILHSYVLRVVILILYGGFFAFCATGIKDVDLGLTLKDVVPDDKYLFSYAKYSVDHFGSYAIYLVADNVDFSTTIEEQRALEYAFAHEVPNVDIAEESTNYARYYTDHAESSLGIRSLCTIETDLYVDNWKSGIDQCALKDITEPNSYLNCAKTCLAVPVQTVVGATVTKRCAMTATNSSHYTCKCPYRAIRKPAKFVDDFVPFLESGLRGAVAAALVTLKPDNKTVASSRSLFYVNDLFDVRDKVKHIKKAREVIKQSDLVKKKGANVFAFDYSLYALNEQYVHIEQTTVFALGMSLIAAFFCMLFLIMHPGTCLIVTLLIAMVEVQLYGLVSWAGLKLNAVVMVNLVMSMGIAVEFLSHIARAFMLAQGTRSERAAAAVQSLGSATSNGALTTFLGIAPIAFSAYAYFVKYFFLHYLVIIVICLFQGVIVLPVVLSLVGPAAFEPEHTEKDANRV